METMFSLLIKLGLVNVNHKPRDRDLTVPMYSYYICICRRERMRDIVRELAIL